MKVENILDWQAFYYVAKHASFTKAAVEMRCGVANISKRIQRLEEILGVKLLQRNTRRLALSRDAEKLIPHVEAILSDLENLESQLDTQAQLSGTISITCLPNLSSHFLAPILSEFSKKYPDIDFDVHLSDVIENLIESKIDIAIRAHGTSDSSLILKKLSPMTLKLCASPSYLAKNPAPLKTPIDLLQHRILMLPAHQKCKFQSSAIKLGKFVEKMKIRCQSGSFLTDMALLGHGIVVRAHWDIAAHIKSGRIVEVLPGYPLEPYGHIFAALPVRKFMPERVRVFLDFIEEQAPNYLTT